MSNKKLKATWSPDINQDIDAITNKNSPFYEEELIKKKKVHRLRLLSLFCAKNLILMVNFSNFRKTKIEK